MKNPKSEATAFYWSLGATLIPNLTSFVINDIEGHYSLTQFIISASGAVIGPSIGHLYAERWGRGLATIGLRIGLGSLGAGIVFYEITTESNFESKTAVLLFTATSIPFVCSMIYDIYTAPSSARKYNESIGKTGNVYLMPRFNTKEESYGFSVVYCF
ncbi:hypothetical protein KAX08_01990 [candidate division WOR-3 bacterium]|nr:hypothetical protein [candidate division WOR-3 bacterium]